MTSFFTTIPMADALWNAPREMGMEEMDWLPNDGNGLQEMVWLLKEPSLALANTLNRNGFLTSKASNEVAIVNAFLAAGGFPEVQLRDNGVANRFYAASILRLLGQFYQSATPDYVLPKIEKMAMRFGQGAGVCHFDVKGRRVVEIPTDSDFSLFISEPTPGVNDYSMVEDWQEILGEMKPIKGNGVILAPTQIPTAPIDVSGMVGMRSGNWVIDQALMAAKFALTPRYVKFEAAFACGGKFFGLPTINEPKDGDYLADHALYLALAQRDSLPLAVGRIDVDDISGDCDLE